MGLTPPRLNDIQKTAQLVNDGFPLTKSWTMNVLIHFKSNPILLVLNISVDFHNILINALEILWENQFDQTALMLIIHSYHKTIWHLILSLQPDTTGTFKHFQRQLFVSNSCTCFKKISEPTSSMRNTCKIKHFREKPL